MYKGCDHLLELIHELGWLILAALYLAQVFLPDSGQFSTLKEFLVDEVYQACAGWSGVQVLLFLAHVTALV